METTQNNFESELAKYWDDSFYQKTPTGILDVKML